MCELVAQGIHTYLAWPLDNDLVIYSTKYKNDDKANG
jgi:hypothetical protein